MDDQQDDEQEDTHSSTRPLLNGFGGRSQVGDPDKKPPRPAPDSPTASTTLELSTSQLAEIAAEVRNSMSASYGQNGAWLGNVVVETLCSVSVIVYKRRAMIRESSSNFRPPRQAMILGESGPTQTGTSSLSPS